MRAYKEKLNKDQGDKVNKKLKRITQNKNRSSSIKRSAKRRGLPMTSYYDIGYMKKISRQLISHTFLNNKKDKASTLYKKYLKVDFNTNPSNPLSTVVEFRIDDTLVYNDKIFRINKNKSEFSSKLRKHKLNGYYRKNDRRII